jgi:tRNA (uracil-5-)-methyltransferase
LTKDLHISYAAQLQEKSTRLHSLLSPFYKHSITTFSSAEKGYRMRAEFRVWHEGEETFHIMFNQDTKEKFEVKTLPAACDLINEAMSAVISFLHGNNELRSKLFQIDYLASTSNELVISMLYHKPLSEQWDIAATSLQTHLSSLGKVNIIGRARKQKRVIGVDYVLEKLTLNGRKYEFKQIENSFTQPNAQINCKMIEWVSDHVKDLPGDLLELYCGAGNFSIPLSEYFNHVLATEISKTSVAAAQYNIERNHIDNLSIIRLSSEEFTQAYTKVREFYRLKEVSLDQYAFSTVLVDPPRAGLDEETLSLIAKFDNIIYISCNPETLADNLKALCNTHRVTDVALFDQFPFTHHIETGVILTRC